MVLLNKTGKITLADNKTNIVLPFEIKDDFKSQLDMTLPLISLMKVWGWGNAISVENSVYVVTVSFTAFFMPENVH